MLKQAVVTVDTELLAAVMAVGESPFGAVFRHGVELMNRMGVMPYDGSYPDKALFERMLRATWESAEAACRSSTT